MTVDPLLRHRRLEGAGLLAATAAVLMPVVLISGCLERAQRAHSNTPVDVAPLEAPAENEAAVSVRQLWRRDVTAEIDVVGGIAAWDDGTIWIGDWGRNSAVWEMKERGGPLELVLAASELGGDRGRGRITGLASVPGGGMLVLQGLGVTFFADRASSGVFVEAHREGTRGFAVFENGDYVVSYGQYPSDPHVAYAVHRYSLAGDHIASWHPAFPDTNWVTVTQMSGGPVAVTQNGDLLVSDPAPFQITRYFGGRGDSATVLVEDESVISSAELRRALPRPGYFSLNWSNSRFVDEMDDGRILNVVAEFDRRRWQSLWVVVSPTGKVLAKTRFPESYWRMSRSGPGRYFARSDGDMLELEVAFEDGQARDAQATGNGATTTALLAKR